MKTLNPTTSDFDGFIYDSKGRRIGVITGIQMHVDAIDVTTHLDTEKKFVPGIKHTSFQGELIPNTEWSSESLTGMWKCAYCRSFMPNREDSRQLTNCKNCGAGRQS